MRKSLNFAIASKPVLVVAPGHKGRGGIDSVVRLHQSTWVWSTFCRLLPTYDDSNSIKKIWAALKAYCLAPLLIGQSKIVHFHLAAQTSMMRKFPIFIMALILRKKTIVHIHAGSEQSLFAETPKWLWKTILTRADKIIALSPSWATRILDHVNSAQVKTIYNPVKSFESSDKRPGSKTIVLYAGKLESRKGFDLLIKAAPQILDRHQDVEFWFAGHGDIDRARRIADALGVNKQVRFIGWIPAEDLESIYKMATIFCLPSYSEGVPMAVLEAMSHGLPVVCTPVGGLPDFITNNVHALFMGCGDVKSLTDAVLKLIDDPDFSYRIAQNGRGVVLEKFSLEKIADNLADLYAELGVHSFIGLREVANA